MPDQVVSSVPALSIPTTVISQQNIDHALGLIRDAKALKICGVEDLKKAGEYLNSLGRTRTFFEAEIKRLRAPFVEQANRISGEGKPHVEAITNAEATLNNEMRAYDRLQKEEQRKAEMERQRLADEARRAQEAAAKAVEAAKTEKAFEKAEEQFHQGLAKAEEAKAVDVPQVYKPTGAKGKKTAVIESFDLAKLPLTYHLLDEAKVKKAILAGILDENTPGLKFRIDESFIGTGR
jgi:hypothetical protein